ncbi:MAG TPA: antitoxin Xre/MbcA/ParS toxin-binding domain-containing protein [Vicinamibacteria bacterium]|nr:antitoxin Xre/MbcA/ParS toxin-binding domain-containing protein [Vicinamibacteria bacterium]
MASMMADQSKRVADLLGGREVFHGKIRAPGDMQRALREGLPFAAFDALVDALEMSSLQLARLLGVATRTLARRKDQGQLSPIESDRLYRVAHVLLLAAEVLGSIDKARHWLTRPNRALGGETPLSYLDTEVGQQQVEDLLLRLSHGIYS